MSEASWSEVSGPVDLPAGVGGASDRAALEEVRRGNLAAAVSALLAAAFQPDHEAQERLLHERRAAAEAAADRLQALAVQRTALEEAAAAEGRKAQALRDQQAALEGACTAATARLVAARAFGAALEAEGASLADAERALRCGVGDLSSRQVQLELSCGLLQGEVEAAERCRAGLLEDAAESEAQVGRSACDGTSADGAAWGGPCTCPCHSCHHPPTHQPTHTLPLAAVQALAGAPG